MASAQAASHLPFTTGRGDPGVPAVSSRAVSEGDTEIADFPKRLLSHVAPCPAVL